MRLIFVGCVLCVAALGACVMDDPEHLMPETRSRVNGAECEGLFDTDVKSLLVGTCKDCHSNPGDKYGAPDFLGLEESDYYASLVSRKDFVSCNIDNSLLLVKGLDPDHPGGALTEPQHDKVREWLAAEAKCRFGGTCSESVPAAGAGEGEGEGDAPEEPLTGNEALIQFGDCMTLEDWEASGMPLVANQTALSQGQQVPCYSCHATGQGSNWMADPNDKDEVTEAFNQMRVKYSIFNLVRWTVRDGKKPVFDDIVQSFRWRDKGTEAENHPPYTLSDDYKASVDTWFNLVYAKWKNGDCKP